jgi:hypothetical protein
MSYVTAFLGRNGFTVPRLSQVRPSTSLSSTAGQNDGDPVVRCINVSVNLIQKSIRRPVYLSLGMSIGDASILDKQRMHSRGRHDRSRCREVEFGPDEIMKSPILIYNLVLAVSSSTHIHK